MIDRVTYQWGNYNGAVFITRPFDQRQFADAQPRSTAWHNDFSMNEENRVLDVDREWNEAYPRLDVSALDRVIADDWVCIDGSGMVITKDELLARVASSASFLD